MHIDPSELDNFARTLACMLRAKNSPEEEEFLQNEPKVVQAYLRGVDEAAAYLGVAKSTLIDWQNTRDPDGLLVPRIINGRAYFAKTRLNQFMDTSNNAPGALTRRFGS